MLLLGQLLCYQKPNSSRKRCHSQALLPQRQTARRPGGLSCHGQIRQLMLRPSSRVMPDQALGQTLTRRTGLQSAAVSHPSVTAESAESGHCHHQAAGTFHECKADECSAVQQASLKPVEACRACRNTTRAPSSLLHFEKV